MPIEAVRGPGGGYQLRPGFKLPPLMFTEEEATALVLGLLGTSWLELDQSSVAVEGALAKVLRVLSPPARERLNAVASHIVLSSAERNAPPAAALLIELSEAVQRRQRVALVYRSHHDAVTRRTVEPYSLVGWWGYWYLVAYCCLRQGYRLFRLDRVQRMEVQAATFTHDATFDSNAYLREHLGRVSDRWQIQVEFHAPLSRVQDKIPASHGRLTETSTGVVFETQHSDLADVARFLVTRNLPFVAREPPELRAELMRLAAGITASATPPG